MTESAVGGGDGYAFVNYTITKYKSGQCSIANDTTGIIAFTRAHGSNKDRQKCAAEHYTTEQCIVE